MRPGCEPGARPRPAGGEAESSRTRAGWQIRARLTARRVLRRLRGALGTTRVCTPAAADRARSAPEAHERARLFDRYRRPVVSFAVLADDRAGWRPTCFSYALWGSEVSLRYRTVKLLDHEAALEADSQNPFALIALAHLKAARTRKLPRQRLHWKVELMRRLYARGYGKGPIRALFRLLDWLLTLPEELDREFDLALDAIEEEVDMPFVTRREKAIQEAAAEAAAEAATKARAETLAEMRQVAAQVAAQAAAQARQDDLLQFLEARFGELPASLNDRLRAIDEVSELHRLVRLAATAPALEAFQAGLPSA